MFGLEDGGDLSVGHNEYSPSRIKSDEDDVIKIMQQFIRFKVFDCNQNDLFSLTTKDVASEDVRQALFTAEDKGKKSCGFLC